MAFYEVEIDPAELLFGALSIHDGRPVDLVHFLVHRSTQTRNDHCDLQDHFVEFDPRGQGTGRRLIEHIYEEARRAETSRIYWLTQDINQDVTKLWRLHRRLLRLYSVTPNSLIQSWKVSVSTSTKLLVKAFSRHARRQEAAFHPWQTSAE